MQHTKDTKTVILDVKNLICEFNGKPALKDLSFDIRLGEIVTLIGRSGAGKSTLLRCLCGLEKPTSGSVVLNGADLTKLSAHELELERRKIGLVFQHFNLLNHCTVASNIMLPLRINKWPRHKWNARVKELLDLVGLSGMGDKYPSQLSGGQKQRVGIARALAAKPDLLLCDEATSALDPEATRSVLSLLEEINRTLGVTIIMITHEMDIVQKLGERILVLDHGDLIADTSLLKLTTKPPRALENIASELRITIPNEVIPTLSYDRNADPVVRIWFDSTNKAQSSLVTEVAKQFDLEVMILHGGVFYLQQTNMGDILLRLHGERSLEAVEHLRSHTIDLEILGYASDV